MPRRASQPGRSAWSAAAWRASGRRLVAAAEAEQADRPGRGQLDPRRAASTGRRSASAMRSASAGRPAPASSVARRASTAAISLGVGEPLAAPPRGRRARRRGRGDGRSGCRRGAWRGGRAGRRSSGSSHTAATSRSTSSSSPEHGVGLDEHLGPVAGGDVARRPAIASIRRIGERRVVAGERQPGGAQQRLAGDRAAGGDPPEGDLDDVLAAAGAVGLDDVGELGVDAAQPQRRQPGAQHLAVQRVGQAHGGPPARGDDRRRAGSPRAPPASPRRGRRSRSARPNRSQTASSSSTASPAASTPARCSATSSSSAAVVGSGAGEVPGAADLSTSTPRSAAPRTSSVSTCRLPPESRASSASAVGRHRAVEGAVEQGAELVGRRAARAPCGRGGRRGAGR